jgi:hypothetical protein
MRQRREYWKGEISSKWVEVGTPHSNLDSALWLQFLPSSPRQIANARSRGWETRETNDESQGLAAGAKSEIANEI